MVRVLSLLGLASAALAANGPYQTYYYVDSSLSNHTIFQPTQFRNGAKGDGTKVPVVIWTNGACYLNSLDSQNFINELASWGVLVIVSGTPTNYPPAPSSATTGDGSTFAGQSSQLQVAAVNWISQVGGTGSWTHVDKTRIATSGFSCGGIDAILAGKDDTRVSNIFIFSSGCLTASSRQSWLGNLTKPAFYFMGGPSDVAYSNSVSDWNLIKQDNRIGWRADDTHGHGGSLGLTNGGPHGVAAIQAIDWLLKGNDTARAFFSSDSAIKAAGFVDWAANNLDKIVTPSPIGRNNSTMKS